MTTPDNITVAQAADILGVHQITVIRRCRAKTLRSWKRGKIWVIPRAGVLALKKQWEEGTG